MSEFWRGLVAKANMITEMRRSGRYPYTHAYDLIREAGLADSRAAASVWVDLALETYFKDTDSVNKESFCVVLAEQAIEYLASYDLIEETKKGHIKELIDMNVPAVTTEACWNGNHT